MHSILIPNIITYITFPYNALIMQFAFSLFAFRVFLFVEILEFRLLKLQISIKKFLLQILPIFGCYYIHTVSFECMCVYNNICLFSHPIKSIKWKVSERWWTFCIWSIIFFSKISEVPKKTWFGNDLKQSTLTRNATFRVHFTDTIHLKKMYPTPTQLVLNITSIHRVFLLVGV